MELKGLVLLNLAPFSPLSLFLPFKITKIAVPYNFPHSRLLKQLCFFLLFCYNNCIADYPLYIFYPIFYYKLGMIYCQTYMSIKSYPM